MAELSTALGSARESGGAERVVKVLLDHLPGGEDGRLGQLTELKEILARCSSKVSEMIQTESQKNIVDMTTEGDVVLKIPDAQFIEPRGKFDVTLSETGCYLSGGSSGSCALPWGDLQHIILIPNPTPSKKEGEQYLFFILSSPISVKVKKLSILCWCLSNGGPNLHAQYGPVHFNGKQSDVVSGVTEALYSHPICRPNRSRFQTTTGSSFLRCYKGVQEGVLYPLEEGILFFKPAIFIPSKNVASIAAGRGGSALTRYIDLKIETEDDKTYEYSNIDREELPSIQNYVQFYADQRKREQKKSSTHPEDDDDDDEDDDFDPNAPESSDDEGNGGDSDSSEGSDDDEHGSHSGSDQDSPIRPAKKTHATKKKVNTTSKVASRLPIVVSLDDDDDNDDIPKAKKHRSEI